MSSTPDSVCQARPQWTVYSGSVLAMCCRAREREMAAAGYHSSSLRPPASVFCFVLARGLLDADFAPLRAGLARELLLGKVGEGFLLEACVAQDQRTLVGLNAGHAALDAGPPPKLVDAERRRRLQLAAGHAAHVALAGGGSHAHRGRCDGAFALETLMALLPAWPTELVAGELGNGLLFVARGAEYMCRVAAAPWHPVDSSTLLVIGTQQQKMCVCGAGGEERHNKAG